MTKDNDFGTAKLSRRDFLKLAINTGGGLILAACAPGVVGPIMPVPDGAPGSPTPTQPATTKTATATSTATETPSPESLLPQEVKEKFELAGIDLANMENAQYDKDGLHITLDSGKVIVLTNTDLQKGIYNGQDNVLQYRGEFNDSVVYTFDKESGKWVKTSMIELDLVDGGKMEVRAFGDKQEVMDFVASDAMWFEIKKSNINPIPLTNEMKKKIMALRDRISGIVPKNGAGLLPPYPMLEINDIKKYFLLFIYDIGENKVVIIYPSKNNEPAVVFFDDPSLKNDRFNLAPFIVNTWKYNDGN